MVAPTDVQVTSSGTTTIHTLPQSNPAGTSDTIALPFQGVTGGVPVSISASSLPLPAGAAADGSDATGVIPPAGATGIRGWLSGIFYKLNTSIAVTGTFWQATQPVSLASLPALAAGSNVIGVTTCIIANPSSSLTRPANTTTYGTTANILIASNTVAGSIIVPSILVGRVAAANFFIRRLRLTTNVTTAWDQATFKINLWTAAPTYTNGDGGVYAVATGAAGFLGSFNIVLNQFGDGASGVAAPAIGGEAGIALASGQIIYWDLQVTTATALTPISGQTFTLTVEDWQN